MCQMVVLHIKYTEINCSNDDVLFASCCRTNFDTETVEEMKLVLKWVSKSGPQQGLRSQNAFL